MSATGIGVVSHLALRIEQGCELRFEPSGIPVVIRDAGRGGLEISFGQGLHQLMHLGADPGVEALWVESSRRSVGDRHVRA